MYLRNKILKMCAIIFFIISGCSREKFIEVTVSGSVNILSPDGSLTWDDKITGSLSGDFNTNGAIDGEEQFDFRSDGDGKYEITTRVPAKFRGNLVITLKREGYVSFIRTLPSQEGKYTINAVLLPSEDAKCEKGVCRVFSNMIRIENLPENVSGGFMRVFSPVTQSEYFPGNFEDSDGKMLISTVFSEIELYDSEGNKITSPGDGQSFKVKMLIPRESYVSIKDLNPETEDVEVPMFYFDEVQGVWVESEEGWLEYENSIKVKNAELAGILNGDYKGNVFSVFYAPHLSWWNVDWKNNNVTCLMGRVIIDGNVTSGAFVEAAGINYNSENMLSFWRNVYRVSSDGSGWFVVGVYRSENASEDADGDGLIGETHRSNITISYNGTTWNLGEFVSPNMLSPYAQRNISCIPPECVCQNLGDFNLSTVQTTPPCELYGIVRYSGVENVSGGAGNAPPQGSSVTGVTVNVIDSSMSAERRNEICVKQGTDLCTPQVSDSEGKFHIYYAVDTNAIYNSTLTLSYDNVTGGFGGTGTISGCPVSSEDNPYVIWVDYFYTRTGNYPDAPGNVNAGGECGELTTISWIDRSDNEDGFEIVRKEEGEDYKLLADLVSDTIVHPDSTTKRDTNYCYQVIAYRLLDDIKYSSPSREFCFTTSSKFCPPPPPSPSNLSGTGAAGLVSLTWKGVCRESGYKITRRAVTDGPCSEGGEGLDIETVYKKGYVEIGVTDVNAMSFDDTRVSGNTCYCYRAFAFNDAGNSGSSNSFCLVVPECQNGYTRSCYSGPPGSENVGMCHGEIQTCTGGFWPLVCSGEVIPGEEVCDGYDNDCDGQIDEVCSCTDGTSQPCYSGPPGTEGVGVCSTGTQLCSGNQWGACTGDVIPSSEICGDGLDNDCDGIPEDGCDLTPPETTITSSPPSVSAEINATFTFTCNESNCSFACQLDGAEYNPCISPCSFLNLTGGNHTFHVRAIDGANNSDPSPAFYSWFIDTFPPETTITSYPPDPSGSGDATFEFTCNESNCTFECKLDNSGWETCSSPKTYNGLFIGRRTFYVRAIDPYNNIEATPASYSWTISANNYTLWVFTTQSYVKSSPVVYDVNGDGISEVIIGSDDYKLYVIEGINGALKWNFTTTREITSSVAVGDIDSDGLPEIIVGSYDYNLYALNGEDGTVLWMNTLVYTGASSPALADIDNDGKLEVVVGGSEIFALNGEDGSVLWRLNLSANIESSPSFVDLDGDGLLEIVLGADNSKVYAVNGEDGSILWSVNAGDKVISSPAIGDIDGDGLPEVVVGSFDGKIYAFNGENGGFLWSFQTGAPVTSSPALGDIDGDSIPDVVDGSGNSYVYGIKGNSGSLLWSQQTGYDVYSSPALADIDNDGKLEVIIGSADNNLYALNAEDGSTLWLYPTGNWVSSSPAVYDLDGDGNLDVVFGSWDNKVYAIKTSNTVPPSNLIPWPKFKHDFKNTGLFTGNPNPPW